MMWPASVLLAVPLLVLLIVDTTHCQLKDLDAGEYEWFFNTGSSSKLGRHYHRLQKTGHKDGKLKNGVHKSKVEVLGEVLKRRVETLRKVSSRQVELVFLVDSSSSVGIENYYNELKFVKKLLADFTVAFNYTRVALITFSSRSSVIRFVDHLTDASHKNHKCRLLGDEMPKVNYTGGGTFTYGAVIEAQKVFESARPNASKALFLITDGYSNGMDPRPAAKDVRDSGVELFTFGIKNGNVRELYDMASEPKPEHSYIMDSFEEFEALARRALHEDLHVGNYEVAEHELCSNLCEEAEECCDDAAECTCGTHTGHYACLCNKGHYGTGLRGDCKLCPAGTYSNTVSPSDISSCKQCPDLNHQSNPGSTSVSDCKCRKGYRSKGETRCVVLECAEMVPPLHGFLVKKPCGSTYNSACTLDCDPGYTLHGSSIRICGEDSRWGGENTVCIAKTCPPLKMPRHGEMTCSTGNFTFETRCNFSCEPGFILVGSHVRNCLATATWDGLSSHCRPVTCQPLPLLRDGIVSPSKCTSHKSQYGDSCDLSCNRGFALIGPSKRQCVQQDIWTSQEKKSRCVDVTAPELVCPTDVFRNTDDNENSATVTWSPPSAVDNSNEAPTVVPVPAVFSPMSFPIGRSVVTYVAEDKSGNRAECNFTITVSDVEPPVVDKCSSPPTFLSRNKSVSVEWDEPIFSDNSGGPVNVERSQNQGDIFSLGQTVVVYTVWDEAGNNSTCNITITVQEHACTLPMDPINGHSNCSEQNSGVFCSLTCEEGYAFAIRPHDMYFCAYDGMWSPSNKLPFPDCAVTVLPTEALQNGVITLQSEDIPCQDAFFIHQVESKMKRKLSNKVVDYCTDGVNCDVAHVSAECETFLNKAKDESNYLFRRRRSIGKQSRNLIKEPPSASKRNKVPFVMKDATNSSKKADLKKILLKFQLKGKVASFNDSDRLNGSSVSGGILDALEQLHLDAEKGGLDLQMGQRNLTYSGLRWMADAPQFACDVGSVLRGNSCVKCPVGTFYNVISEDCQACEKGTYQFAEGQFSCLICPDNTSTRQGYSKSPGECKAQCLPGSFSADGLETCETCDRGTYQPAYAQTSCIPCPGIRTTWRRGSRREFECRELCPSGFVSETGLAPCYPCPSDYIQLEKGQRSCYRCDGNGFNTSSSSDDCRVNGQSDATGMQVQFEELLVNDCFSVPCLNGGTCEALTFAYFCHCEPGYTGMQCETEVDECSSFPCQNGGTCQGGIGVYECDCMPGYEGLDCEVKIDECLSMPCANNGTCINDVSSFYCSCSNGFEGRFCETNIDDCVLEPCRNGGSCSDKVAAHTCNCQEGFLGADCEIDVDECDSGPCQNGATCSDLPGQFMCKCLRGFLGTLCETDIDECASEPCGNGATCVDQVDTFHCVCPPSFSGVLCETRLLPDFVMHFPISGIMDYAQADGFQRDLAQVSFCLWMKNSDCENYGTPVSYANETVDNLFSLVDYNGFALYVNGQHVITDVTANDGKWHFVCVTWTNDGGSWKIYKDGLLQDSGHGLANGTLVSGDGHLVVGQEQDRFKGGFSDAESFIGQIGRLDFWGHVLTSEEVSQLTTTCDPYYGDVRAWPDFLAGMKGRVKLEDSTFCKGCTVPTLFENGDVRVKGVGMEAVLNYRCLPGYTLKGSGHRRCMVDGDWQGKQPHCERKSCGFPGYLANGYIHSSGYLFMDVIRYECNVGFRLVGNDTRVCLASGNWRGRTPSCKEILCPPLSIPEHGKVAKTPARFHSTVHVEFECTSGYRIDGAVTLTCTSDGAWDEDPPVCQPVYCNSPPHIEHGRIIGDAVEYAVNETVTFACDDGFRPEESESELRCTVEKQWVGDVPRCIPVDCGPPTPIANGSVHTNETIFDSLATYSCNKGYKLSENSSAARCGRSGRWEGDLPQCSPIACPFPKGIRYGDMKVTTVVLGSVVTYSCMDGYELSGDVERTCLFSGGWSGSQPKCFPVKCDPPEGISNGNFSGKEPWVVGTTLIYKCDSGYERQGSSQRTCLDDGHWSHHAPTCIPLECSVPIPIANGFSVGGAYTCGSVVLYGCDEGYWLEGNVTRECTVNGTWSGAIPICHRVSCGSVDNIKYGQVVFKSFLYLSRVSYQCDPGFELIGPSVRKCQSNGTWSEYEPQCVPAHCPPPDEIDYGEVSVPIELLNGAVAEYSCHVGHVLVGDTRRICDGTSQVWSGALSRCFPVNCTAPEAPTNGVVRVTSVSFDSHAEYECAAGYKLVGSSVRACLNDGSWSEETPVCQQLRCIYPEGIPNGTVLGESYMVNAIIQFQCDVGYRLEGLKNVTCLDNENWSAAFPTCAIISCPWQLLSPLHGFVHGSGHQYTDVIQYSCMDGYELVGTSSRVCLADETWSGSEPSCDPVQCALPKPPKHGHLIVEDGTSYGSVIRYECTEGYSLVGDSVQNCLKNKQWSSLETPRCTPTVCHGPPAVDNGNFRVSDAELKLGAVVYYTCDEGFEKEGTDHLQCVIPGQWNDEPPKCNRIRCSNDIPWTFSHGRVLAQFNRSDIITHEFGSELKFVCHDGYKLMGEPVVKCIGPDEWSAPFPSCAITSCPPQSRLSHGKISAKEFTIGAKISYSCDVGYTLVGRVNNTCSKDGVWHGTPPKCLRIKCPNPTKVANAILVTTTETMDFFYGDNATYECHAGFTLHGESTLVCSEGGRWNSQPPSCGPIFCSPPQGVPHGTMTITTDVRSNASLPWGAVVTYSCHKGYVPDQEMDRMRRCGEDGQWTGRPVVCLAITCESPSRLQYGRVRYESLMFGAFATYECDDGYQLNSVANRRHCTESGMWSEEELRCEIIRCPEVVPLAHGSVSYIQGNGTYGTVISLECLPDFQLVGQAIWTCLADGSWNGADAYCKRVECPIPEIVANATFELDSTLVGGTVTYTCNAGYKLLGEPVITCMITGEWSDVEPRCLVVECPELSALQTGLVVATNGEKVGSLASYSCVHGYELFGVQRRTCIENGTWSGSVPSCSLIECSQPAAIFNGRVVTDGLNLDDVVNYSCDEGFELLGNISRKCQADRQWGGRAPTCQVVTCPPVGDLVNGRILNDGGIFADNHYSYNSTLRFACSRMYSVKGDPAIRCLATGVWNGTVPTCARSNCDQLPNIADAILRDGYRDYKLNSTVEYVCRGGFEMGGSTLKLRCSSDGRWVGPVPHCVPITCGRPPEVPKAALQVITPDGQLPNSYGSTAVYSCPEGYEMTGSPALICEENRQWFGHVPTCSRLLCGSPPMLEHATVQVENYKRLSRATYSCQEGYSLQSTSSIRCAGNGHWEHDDKNVSSLECVPVKCGEPVQIYKGKVSFTGVKYASTAHYSCPIGYRLTGGTAHMVCAGNGLWKGSRPRCHPITCPPPELPSNSVLGNDGEFRFGMTVTYKCRQGYRMVGQSTRMCQENGTWTGGIPQCQLVQCTEPLPPLHGYVMMDDRKLGDVARFFCEDGYEMQGENSTKCGEDDKWTVPVPTCSVVTCEPPVPPPNATSAAPIVDGYVFGDSVTFSCISGHFPTRGMTASCQANGTWTNPAGRCEELSLKRVNCGRPQVKDGAVILGTSFSSGDRVTYSCPPGLHHVGSGILRCQEDGLWDLKPSCKRLCQKPCLNGGVCLPNGKCLCPAGYFGDQCQSPICLFPCLNGGTCVHPYRCLCKFNFVGTRCQIPVCDPPCNNDGRCMAPNLCRCLDGRKTSNCTNNTFTMP